MLKMLKWPFQRLFVTFNEAFNDHQRSGRKKVRNWITRCLTTSAGSLNYQEYETFLRQALSWICWNRCIEKVPGPYAPKWWLFMVMYHDKLITSRNSKEYITLKNPLTLRFAQKTPQRRPCSFPRVFVENLVTLLVRPARVRLSKLGCSTSSQGNLSDFGVPKIWRSCLYNRTFLREGWWFS